MQYTIYRASLCSLYRRTNNRFIHC